MSHISISPVPARSSGGSPTSSTPAYGAVSARSPLGQLTIARRAVGARDVLIEILYCGVCHSDVPQEMLDHCAEHGIVSDVEVISIQRINEAHERMIRNDVRYRFVIDLASLAR